MMKRAALIAGLLACAAAQADSLSVKALRFGLPTSPGGTEYERAVRRTLLPRFAALTHHSVRIVTLAARPAKSLEWDIAQLDPITLSRACADRTAVRINWGRLGGRTRVLPIAASDCGVGAYLYSTVLTWDPAKVPGTPSWADFWNVVRVPGKRGLRRSPIGTLEIALMADGVPPRDVYTVLRQNDGVERAFRKLDQLRPYVVWWSDSSEPMSIVGSGGALMSSAPNERVTAVSRRLHRNFGRQWRGSITMVQSWAIRAHSSNSADAAQLIEAALDPARQAALLGQTGLGSTTPETGHLDPATVAVSPAANLDGTLLFDGSYWRDNEAVLTARFDAWLRR